MARAAAARASRRRSVIRGGGASTTATGKKRVVGAVLFLGLAALAVAGIALRASLRERFWLWKLDASGSDEELLKAARRLEQCGSVRAIPRLIESLELAARRSGRTWRMDRSTSRLLALREVFVATSGGAPGVPGAPNSGRFLLVGQESADADVGLLACVRAIRSISRRTGDRAERLLRSYLKDGREIVRAAAASVLFDDRKGAWEFVASERLLPPPAYGL